MNNQLTTTNQNAKLVLAKSKTLLDITSKILANRFPRSHRPRWACIHEFVWLQYAFQRWSIGTREDNLKLQTMSA